MSRGNSRRDRDSTPDGRAKAKEVADRVVALAYSRMETSLVRRPRPREVSDEQLRNTLGPHWLWLQSEGKKGQPANLWNVDLRRTDLRKAHLQKADLRHANLQEANLCGANLEEAILRGANLVRATLRGANASNADLRGADISGADLQGATLSGANLRRSNMSVANLQEADLSGTNLQGAFFRDANLTNADLRGADLRSASELTQDQLDVARGDAETQLPPGLTIRRHRMGSTRQTAKEAESMGGEIAFAAPVAEGEEWVDGGEVAEGKGLQDERGRLDRPANRGS